MDERVRVTAEIAARQSVVDIIRKVGEAANAFAKQGAIPRDLPDKLKQTHEHASKVGVALGKIGTAFGSFASAAGTTAFVGGAVVAGVALVAKGLGDMSTSSLNLHYAARELGIAPKDFVDIRQGLMRLGLSHEEATDKLTGFFDMIRDMTQKGAGSGFYREAGSFGKGSQEIRDSLIDIYKKTGDGRAVIMAYAQALQGLTQDQQRQMASAWGLPQSVVDLADAMARNREIVILSKEQAWDYKQAWENLKVGLMNLKNTVGADLIVAMNNLYKELAKRGVIEEFNKALVDVGKGFLAIVDAITPKPEDTYTLAHPPGRGADEIREDRRKRIERMNRSPFMGMDVGSPGAATAATKNIAAQEIVTIKNRSVRILADIYTLLTGPSEGEGQGPGQPRARTPGQWQRGVYGGGGKIDMSRVNPELAATLEEAKKSGALPEGYTVSYISGYRHGDPRYHGGLGTGQALATDIVIRDPQGRQIGNLGFGPGTEEYKIYSKFALAMKAAQERLYPERHFTWGGHFRSRTPRDLMHMQWGGPSNWSFIPSEVATEKQRQMSRDDGGPVHAGESYIVGGRGPELFRPTVSGQIISSAKAFASGGTIGLAEQLGFAPPPWAKASGEFLNREDTQWAISLLGILPIGGMSLAKRNILDMAVGSVTGAPHNIGIANKIIDAARRRRTRARLNLNVIGPPGTQVSADGTGMFKENIALRRQLRRVESEVLVQ